MSTSRRRPLEETDKCSRAYIYARYSSHNQKDTSIEQQVREIQQYCQQNGIRVIGEYADRAVSGKTDKRPEFQRLMRDCAKGYVQYVVVYKVDRFARNRYDAAMYKARLKRYNVRVLYAKESIPDGPEGILLESVLEGSAEYYSANLAQNIRRGMMENALECKVNNGGLPLGYRKGADGRYEIEPVGAAIIRDVYSMYTRGINIIDICADLNARGLRTSRGARFNKNSLRVILRNERYIGVYKYGDVRIEDGVPSILSREVYDMAQKQIAKNARAPASSWSSCDYLLTGKLFCGLCGRPMVGESGTSKSGNKHNYYICISRKRDHSCTKRTVKKDWLEKIVVMETAQRVLVPSVIDKIADAVIELQKREREAGELPTLKAQLRDINKILGNVMTAIEQGIITPTTKQRMQELEQQRIEIENAIDVAQLQLTTLTKEQVVYWMNQFRKMDTSAPDYCQKIIEIFVNSVYLYDDRIKIGYNYTKNNKETVDLKLIEALDSTNEPSCVFGVDAFVSRPVTVVL